jgi:hypothetical protein
LGIFDKYLWHPFVIFSFSWNLFFLEVIQPVIQRRIGKKWSISATTCVWTAWFFSLGFFVGGVHGSFMGIIGLIATQFSLFLICSYAFYKSGSIVGQIFLLGVVVALA